MKNINDLLESGNINLAVSLLKDTSKENLIKALSNLLKEENILKKAIINENKKNSLFINYKNEKTEDLIKIYEDFEKEGYNILDYEVPSTFKLQKDKEYIKGECLYFIERIDFIKYLIDKKVLTKEKLKEYNDTYYFLYNMRHNNEKLDFYYNCGLKLKDYDLLNVEQQVIHNKYAKSKSLDWIYKEFINNFNSPNTEGIIKFLKEENNNISIEEKEKILIYGFINPKVKINELSMVLFGESIKKYKFKTPVWFQLSDIRKNQKENIFFGIKNKNLFYYLLENYELDDTYKDKSFYIEFNQILDLKDEKFDLSNNSRSNKDLVNKKIIQLLIENFKNLAQNNINSFENVFENIYVKGLTNLKLNELFNFKEVDNFLEKSLNKKVEIIKKFPIIDKEPEIKKFEKCFINCFNRKEKFIMNKLSNYVKQIRTNDEWDSFWEYLLENQEKFFLNYAQNILKTCNKQLVIKDEFLEGFKKFPDFADCLDKIIKFNNMTNQINKNLKPQNVNKI